MFTEELKSKFAELGFKDVTIKYREVENHDVKDMFLGAQVKRNSSHSLMELFRYHNEHNENILAHGTMKNYYTTLAYLNKFISKHYNTDDLPLSKIDYSFIERFEHFIEQSR